MHAPPYIYLPQTAINIIEFESENVYIINVWGCVEILGCIQSTFSYLFESTVFQNLVVSIIDYQSIQSINISNN